MRKIISWISNLLVSNKLKIIFISEFPDVIKKGVVYIEGNVKARDYWFAKFRCPCGCGDVLTLNLIDDVNPCWVLYINNQKKSEFSMKPSIRRISKCKSHFWIINSKIKWC